jgi:dCMP deaminase
VTSSRPTWDETWMAVARQVGQRSLCVRDQIGAVIVDRNNRIVDTGYNGPPRGWQPIHSDKCLSWCPRNQEEPLHPAYDDCYSIHAEANALMFSDRTRREGGTIYVSSGTCGACAKLVANSGLEQAVYAPGPIHRDSHRWYDFLEACGVTVVIL